MNVDVKDVISLVTLSVVLVLIIKNSKDSVAIIQQAGSSLSTVTKTLQGN